MEAAVIIVLVGVAVAGVLAKIGWDLVGLAREDRSATGRVQPVTRVKIGVILLIVGLVLLWLLLGFLVGDDTPVY
jgi:uncharacterized membrane protein YidH (DUF202 family)